MPHHHERRAMPYRAEQMFDLVADVARYPEFLPWVVGARVRSDTALEDGGSVLVADLLVGFKGLRERFTSRVERRPAAAGQPVPAIDVSYVDGPLSHLHNNWRFEPTEEGCMIDFTVDFQFRNAIFQRLAGQMFERALRKMIGAFEARALELYGDGGAAPSSNSSSAIRAA